MEKYDREYRFSTFFKENELTGIDGRIRLGSLSLAT